VVVSTGTYKPCSQTLENVWPSTQGDQVKVGCIYVIVRSSPPHIPYHPSHLLHSVIVFNRDVDHTVLIDLQRSAGCFHRSCLMQGFVVIEYIKFKMSVSQWNQCTAVLVAMKRKLYVEMYRSLITRNCPRNRGHK